MHIYRANQLCSILQCLLAQLGNSLVNFESTSQNWDGPSQLEPSHFKLSSESSLDSTHPYLDSSFGLKNKMKKKFCNNNFFVIFFQIQALKKEKENLALNYEQEEECLTNDLSRKLNQVNIFITNFFSWKSTTTRIIFLNYVFFSVTTRKGSTWTHSWARAGMPGE